MMVPLATSQGVVHQAAGRQRGVALVAVLWVIVVLTIIASSMALGTQREARLAQNLQTAAEARFAARAQAALVLATLSAPEGNWGWRADGRWGRATVAGHQVFFRVMPASARVDVNRASPSLLAALLATTEVAPERRELVLDGILDWRSRSDARRPQGPRTSDYLKRQLPGPKNTEFESIEELQMIPGIDPDTYARLAPYLTVYSDAAWPDYYTAAIPVLAAYPGMDRRAAERWARERDHELERGGEPPPFPGLGHRGRSGSVLIVQVRAEGAARADLEMVVERQLRTERRPVKILAWREPASVLGWADR